MGGDGPSQAQQQKQQLAGKALASTAPEIVEREGVKRRGAFKIPGGGKARLPRSGSVTPARTPAPAAAVARHIASWDGSQVMVPAISPGPGQPSLTPGGKGGEGEGEGKAIASPTGERGRGTNGAGEHGGSGGVFTSLRHRSGDAAAGRSGGDGLSSKSRNVPAALSAREKGAGDKERKAGVVRGGLSSAPADTQASYKMFFGDTDDGGEGEESGSSDDDEDGLRPRKSFIRVSCMARTSYKLFSSDPQVLLRGACFLLREPESWNSPVQQGAPPTQCTSKYLFWCCCAFASRVNALSIGPLPVCGGRNRVLLPASVTAIAVRSMR